MTKLHPQYEIITNDNQVILCNSRESLNKQLSLLGGNVAKIFKLKASTMPNTSHISCFVTPQLKARMRKRMEDLGITNQSEYIKLLLAVDSEIQFLKSAPDL